MRIKHTFRLPAELSGRLADYAARKRVAQTQIVEAALLSFLSPDGSERLEAAIGRRLDRLSRQSDRLEHHVARSEEHTSELQSLMRISYAVFCLKKKKKHNN